MRLLWALVIVFAFNSCFRQNEDQSEKVKVIAHRGYHYTVLENTLESFIAAYNKGFDHIEFDICFTKDNAPVILHDLDLGHQSDTEAVISDMLLNDVKSVTLNGGFKIPELKETFEKLNDRFQVAFIDLKEPCPDSGLSNFVKIISDMNLYGKTIITSSSFEIVRKLKNLDNKLVLGTDGVANGYETNLDEAMKMKYDVVLVEMTQLDKHLNFIAHANDIRIYAYTANAESEIENILQYEIDGIMSDNPDLVSQLIQ